MNRKLDRKTRELIEDIVGLVGLVVFSVGLPMLLAVVLAGTR